MYKKVFLVWCCLLVSNFVYAADLPVVGLTVDKVEVKPGENVTYTVSYSNDSGEDLTNAVVEMNLDVANGLNFVSSSYPQFWDGNKPYWQINNLASGEGASISFTVNVSSDYQGEGISGQASLSATSDASGSITVGSNSAQVSLIADKTDEEKDKEEDEKDEQESKEETTSDKEEKTVEEKIELVADGAKELVVENVVCGANLSNYQENINQWDNRFLLVGVVSFCLILTIGIVAFFLGRKVR